MKREDPQNGAPRGIVSNYLHNEVSAGDTLSISAPAGDFTVTTEEQPIVLLSGGVGITPIMSMFNFLAETQPEREMTFIHAAANSKVHAMREHVENLTKEHKNITSFVCYANPTEQDRAENRYDKEGFIDLDWLKTILSDNKKDFYFCGPLPFLKVINDALKEWGVPETHRTYELFSPLSTIE